jgi:hypothetical protein
MVKGLLSLEKQDEVPKGSKIEAQFQHKSALARYHSLRTIKAGWKGPSSCNSG